MICPNCKAYNADKEKNCIKCGVSLKNNDIRRESPADISLPGPKEEYEEESELFEDLDFSEEEIETAMKALHAYYRASDPRLIHFALSKLEKVHDLLLDVLQDFGDEVSENEYLSPLSEDGQPSQGGAAGKRTEPEQLVKVLVKEECDYILQDEDWLAL